jgi:predicted ArsR family transcriptional regulator
LCSLGESTTVQYKLEFTTQKRILDYLKDYPKATRQNVADALGNITVNGVKFNIGLLQQYGALERKGGRKNGEWVVVWRDVDDNVPSTEPLPLPTNY